MDPLVLFVNKNHKISLEKYRIKCEEEFPHNVEELISKRNNKRKNINENCVKMAKENKLLKIKLSQVIQEKELQAKGIFIDISTFTNHDNLGVSMPVKVSKTDT
jgi:hypothetical protein